ncbi:uncharacterized protein LOC106884117 [Octopus bimaculoides]|uniref:uncharacterized protein LOC106884117 n=1 Tax=Octopus bimaculoides TaxID=37653 RepID=UPI00071DD99A|nr:uncharacterized protein LOC106884117 [Octopus bimaculoides]|eukprot:XP_014790825.1 PREDICTED: uncharacterized protein LOC106884117 [Octopus bimaculoides]
MGSEQSSLPAGAPGSSLRSQRDEDIPYTTYSISKPIDGVPKSPKSNDDEGETSMDSEKKKFCLCISCFQIRPPYPYCEIDYMMHVLLNSLTDRQRKYAKYTEQFQRVSETLSILNRIKGSIDNIIPKMERLNQMLPETEQLEPFTMKSLPSN